MGRGLAFRERMSRLSVSLGFVPEKTVEKGVLRKQYLIDLRDMNRPDVTRATAALLTADS